MKTRHRFVIVWACGLVLAVALAASVRAAWDKTKPTTNGPALSAEIRNNWSAIETALDGTNLLGDPTFLIWAAGDTTAPTQYTLGGAGATIARTGTGLGDTNTKVGPFSAKVTAGGGATATLLQQLLTTTSFDASFQNGSASLGGWVRCTVASSGRLEIFDGVNTSFSAFHTGGSTFEWLTIAGHSIAGTATSLQAGLSVAATQTCHVSGLTFVLGQIPPPAFIPAPAERVEWACSVHGNLATGTSKCVIPVDRPAIIKSVELAVGTAPTTQAIIVDVNTWDGAAFTSMFSTRPQIAAAGGTGGAQPDTTYARRCVSGQFAGAAVAGAILSVDVDQVGSGTVGADLRVQIRGLSYARPLETFLEYNAIR